MAMAARNVENMQQENITMVQTPKKKSGVVRETPVKEEARAPCTSSYVPSSQKKSHICHGTPAGKVSHNLDSPRNSFAQTPVKKQTPGSAEFAHDSIPVPTKNTFVQFDSPKARCTTMPESPKTVPRDFRPAVWATGPVPFSLRMPPVELSPYASPLPVRAQPPVPKQASGPMTLLLSEYLSPAVHATSLSGSIAPSCVDVPCNQMLQVPGQMQTQTVQMAPMPGLPLVPPMPGQCGTPCHQVQMPVGLDLAGLTMPMAGQVDMGMTSVGCGTSMQPAMQCMQGYSAMSVCQQPPTPMSQFNNQGCGVIMEEPMQMQNRCFSQPQPISASHFPGQGIPQQLAMCPQNGTIGQSMLQQPAMSPQNGTIGQSLPPQHGSIGCQLQNSPSRSMRPRWSSYA